MKIVCLGDSITGVSDLSRYLKWSHILECMIDAKMGPGACSVLNRGIGGNTTADILARLQKDVLDEKPDLGVLLIGGNDAAPGKLAREETRRNLDGILGSLRAAGCRILALQYAVLEIPDAPEKTWRHLDGNNDLIAEAAKEHGAVLLDLGPPMQAARAALPFAALVCPADGVHLNPGGELVVARQVFARLTELGWA